MSQLKEYRKKADLTQTQLAELVGQTPGSISHYETANRVPDLEVAKKIVDVLISRGVPATIEDVFLNSAA